VAAQSALLHSVVRLARPTAQQATSVRNHGAKELGVPQATRSVVVPRRRSQKSQRWPPARSSRRTSIVTIFVQAVAMGVAAQSALHHSVVLHVRPTAEEATSVRNHGAKELGVPQATRSVAVPRRRSQKSQR